MKRTTVSDNDYTLMISALDSILDDAHVQKKIIEAMKIVESDERASHMLQAGSDDIESFLEDNDTSAVKAELAFALQTMIDIVEHRQETYLVA